MAEAVSLTVAGQRHEGWTEVTIVRAIDTMVGSFELALSESWAERPERFVLEAGASATLSIGGERVISGYIDRLSPSLARDQHPIIISGRDRAADLIDCSAVANPGSWQNASIETIAAELARPFGIDVLAKASTGPRLRKFALQPGETVQAALERLLRFAGLLAVSNAAGAIELIEPAKSAPVETIVEGENMLDGQADHDVSGRYSTIIVKGQSSGDDTVHGKAATALRAEAKDPAVTRYRPLLIVAEEQATTANLQKRAQWEATSRAGRAQLARVRVRGWRRPDGELRAPNAIVSLDAPSLFMRGAMLVQSVTFHLGREGETAELELVPPEAWRQLPVPEKAEASRIGKKKKKAKAA